MSFQPGDIVECVDNKPARSGLYAGRLVPLTVGQLYTIAKCLFANDGATPVVRLREVLSAAEVEGRKTGGFAVGRFRHIHRPDPKLIELLLSAPVDADAREPEVVF